MKLLDDTSFFLAHLFVLKLGIFLVYIFNAIPKVPHTHSPNPLRSFNKVILDYLPQSDDGHFSGTTPKWCQNDTNRKTTGRNESIYIYIYIYIFPIKWDNDILKSD
jgi:hypothetical protein